MSLFGSFKQFVRHIFGGDSGKKKQDASQAQEARQATSRVFRDSDGRDYCYERGYRVYLDGAPPPPDAPKEEARQATSAVFHDSDGRDYRYERGYRVYLDGAPPPPDSPIVTAGTEQVKGEREAESKARAEQNAEEARKQEELQARFKATAKRRKRNADRIKKILPTSHEEPKKTAETIEPEEEQIPKDADWDESFDDLDSAYWEWFFDRRQSLSFGEPTKDYERDKDE